MITVGSAQTRRLLAACLTAVRPFNGALISPVSRTSTCYRRGHSTGTKSTWVTAKGSHRFTSKSASALQASAGGMAAPKEVPFEPENLPSVGVSGAQYQSWQGDLLVLGVHEEDIAVEGDVVTIKSNKLQAANSEFASAIADIVSLGGFEGKQGTTSQVARVGSASTKAKNVALVGLGKAAKAAVKPDWGTSPYQAMGTAVATLAKNSKLRKVGVAFLEPPADAAAAQAQVATGTLLGAYESTRFKTKKSPTASRLESLEVLLDVPGDTAAASLKKANTVARGTLLTRFLVEAPPNICTPTHLADAAKHIASNFPQVTKLEILEKAQCAELGMGLYLGVAEASDEPAKFIHLTYTSPGGGDLKKVALVGKGLTFDSGGYNLKAGPGSMIELMKFDMGGAAATLGAARIIAELQPAGVEVHFIIAACENMVSGRGLRPGDILTGASGKTVEVNNTDAEGRLTLADALWFAQEKCGATAIIDSATLTGACIIALGTEIAGLFTPSDAMAESLSAACKAAGEKVWRMPMESNYFEQLKSSVADMKNTGTRSGGSITAALFLKQFVKDEVEWAHLDIAGPVWDEKSSLPTGYGAGTLAHWVMAQGKAQ